MELRSLSVGVVVGLWILTLLGQVLWVLVAVVVVGLGLNLLPGLLPLLTLVVVVVDPVVRSERYLLVTSHPGLVGLGLWSFNTEDVSVQWVCCGECARGKRV
jgi:hypothetical protein